MSRSSVKIRLLANSDCREIALVHIRYLTTLFKGEPGCSLLTAYYQAIASSEGACGYVAVDENMILGYVCGIWSFRQVKISLMRRKWHYLLLWGLMQALIRPSILTSFLNRLVDQRYPPEDKVPTYELRPIVVRKTAQGTGIAKRLVKMLLNDAHSRGYKSVHLFAESNNERSNSFYRKLGFESIGTKKRFNNRFIHYKKIITRNEF